MSRPAVSFPGGGVSFHRSRRYSPSPHLLLSPHTPAERREKFPVLRATEKATHKIMTTENQTTNASHPPLSEDAECRACGFELKGGADVGSCPRCGSDHWYRSNVAARPFRTAEQNISTGYHSRGFALAYLYHRSGKQTFSETDVLRLLRTIRRECEKLGIEPMSDTQADTYGGIAPGFPD